MNTKQKLLRKLPSVDEIIKGNDGIRWLKEYPRRFVLEAIRRVLDSMRKKSSKIFRLKSHWKNYPWLLILNLRNFQLIVFSLS